MRENWRWQKHEGSEQHLSLGLTSPQTSSQGCADPAARLVSAGIGLSYAWQDLTGRALSILLSGNIGGQWGC